MNLPPQPSTYRIAFKGKRPKRKHNISRDIEKDKRAEKNKQVSKQASDPARRQKNIYI